MPDNPARTIRGIPASEANRKVIPPAEEKVYDKWTDCEWAFFGSNIGPRTTGGHIRYIRYRDTPNGPEEDPSGDMATASVPDLSALADNPDWPEARALVEAMHAFAERRGKEQGIF